MKDPQLTPYEQDLLDSFEKGEWVSVPDLEEAKKRYAAYAAYAMQKRAKTKPISIRLSEDVLDGLKEQAGREGIPYQTLISSILHKYLVKERQAEYGQVNDKEESADKG